MGVRPIQERMPIAMHFANCCLRFASVIPMRLSEATGTSTHTRLVRASMPPPNTQTYLRANIYFTKETTCSLLTLHKLPIILSVHHMKLRMGISFLKYFRDSRPLVSPFELKCCQRVSRLLNQVNFLFIVSAPEVELLM